MTIYIYNCAEHYYCSRHLVVCCLAFAATQVVFQANVDHVQDLSTAMCQCCLTLELFESSVFHVIMPFSMQEHAIIKYEKSTLG